MDGAIGDVSGGVAEEGPCVRLFLLDFGDFLADCIFRGPMVEGVDNALTIAGFQKYELCQGLCLIS